MIFRKSSGKVPSGSPPPPIYRCSFCNKSQKDVAKLIAGPKVYICGKCVDICNDIIAEDKGLMRVPAWVEESPRGVEGVVLENPPVQVNPVRCKLCGSVRAVEFCLPIAGRGWLCGSCLDAVREVLDASSPET